MKIVNPPLPPFRKGGMGGFEKSFSMQSEMNKIIVNIDQAVKSYRDLDYTEKIPPHPPLEKGGIEGSEIS
jgi:hypothetical protein